LKLHSILGRGVDILGQTSKNSVIPKDYMAITGDSYAVGLGDWKREQVKGSFFSSPPFQSTHILHKKTGQDVVTFGKMGSGSIQPVVEMISTFDYLNSLWAFQLDKPKRILVYFYEGNDIYDNITDIFLRFDKNGYDRQLFYNNIYFEKFMREVFLEKDLFAKKNSLVKNFIFAKVLFSALKENWNYLKQKLKFDQKTVSVSPKKDSICFSVSPKAKSEHSSISTKPRIECRSDLENIDINRISIGENEIQLPIFTQGPPFVGKSIADKENNVTKDYFDMAVYIFEQSLLLLQNHFKEVPIVIVYIPSPLSIYSIKSPFVIYKHWIMLNRYTYMKSELIPFKSQEISKSIQNIARRNNFQFLNSRKHLMKTALNIPVHGPKDWNHFNEAGYKTLSKAIIEFSLKKGS